MKEITNVGKRW